MSLRARYLALLTAGALSPTLFAQDSTDATTCGAGDAVSPWADSSTLHGSEQCNHFVVDLRSFETRWGTRLGIAPLLKSSKSGTAFNTSLLSSSTISRLQKGGVDVSGSSYGLWNGPGIGVNNTPANNAAPSHARTTTRATQQFGVAFSEFGTTDAGESYNAVVGGIVNFRPETPSRLYVNRVMAASNSCDIISNLAQFGLGSVDEEGNVYFRADNSGVFGGCGQTPLSANHVYAVQMALRDCDSLNVISNNAIGLKDLPAIDEFVTSSADTHLTPTALPPAISGAGPYLLATTFGNPTPQFVRGPAGGTISSSGFIDPFNNGGTRGTPSYTQDNFSFLGSSAGILASLARDTGGPGIARDLNLWGINAAGGITGTMALTMPGALTDNSNGAATLGPAGTLEFTLYESQVAFRGGNGQVAVGLDQNGDLLAAATGVHPAKAGNNSPINMIAVARVDQNTGAATWTMAAYNYGVSGKPILDGPGGATIGQLVALLNVTGGSPQGPSMSPPMMDSVGNLYFLSAIETFSPAPDYAVGLVRAVYDPDTFSYELDLVCKTGDIHRGVNSDRDWLITFLEIADNNSVSSGSTTSQNIQEVAFADGSTVGLDTADSRALGGLVLNAGIVYDSNDDGDFTTCFDTGVDDNNYNVLLYVGHKSWPDVGFGLAGTAGVPKLEMSGALDPILPSPMEFNLSNMRPGTVFYMILGFSQINAPFKCGTLVPSVDLIFPALPTFGGELSFNIDWPGGGIPANFPLYWQAWIPDPAAICFFAATNGVCTTTP